MDAIASPRQTDACVMPSPGIARIHQRVPGRPPARKVSPSPFPAAHEDESARRSGAGTRQRHAGAACGNPLASDSVIRIGPLQVPFPLVAPRPAPQLPVCAEAETPGGRVHPVGAGSCNDSAPAWVAASEKAQQNSARGRRSRSPFQSVRSSQWVCIAHRGRAVHSDSGHDRCALTAPRLPPFGSAASMTSRTATPDWRRLHGRDVTGIATGTTVEQMPAQSRSPGGLPAGYRSRAVYVVSPGWGSSRQPHAFREWLG